MKRVSIWKAPLILAGITAVGLVLGLFSDGGLGDAVGDVLLAVPVVVGLWFGWLRRAPRSQR
ncbi:hypothetical protein ACFJGW_06930 [Burkholderiaceae bacterium UC74_6]